MTVPLASASSNCRRTCRPGATTPGGLPVAAGAPAGPSSCRSTIRPSRGCGCFMAIPVDEYVQCQQHRPDTDGSIRNVEGGKAPLAEVHTDEVDHVAMDDTVI